MLSVSLTLFKSLDEKDRLWCLNYSLNIWVFIFLSSYLQFYFQKSLYNLGEEFLVSFFVGLGLANIVGSGAGWGVAIPSRFCMGNILLLKWLIFSLASKNNLVLFRKYFFLLYISLKKTIANEYFYFSFIFYFLKYFLCFPKNWIILQLESFSKLFLAFFS